MWTRHSSLGSWFAVKHFGWTLALHNDFSTALESPALKWPCVLKTSLVFKHMQTNCRMYKIQFQQNLFFSWYVFKHEFWHSWKQQNPCLDIWINYMLIIYLFFYWQNVCKSVYSYKRSTFMMWKLISWKFRRQLSTSFYYSMEIVL